MFEFDQGNDTPHGDGASGDAAPELKFLLAQRELEHWFQSRVGRALVANQRSALQSYLEPCYGFHQADIGVSHRIPVGNASSLGHRFSVVPMAESDLPDNTVVSSSTELAVDHDVADLVVLHHALDFSSDPHQTLREAARVLKPNGNLALIGFNPLSIWGAVKLIKRSKGAVWQNRFLSGRRVSDWLSLLGFKLSSVSYHFYEPPVNHAQVIGRFSWLESILNTKVPLGAYYIIMAQKQQGARINVDRAWRRKAKVIGMPVASRTKPQFNEDSTNK